MSIIRVIKSRRMRLTKRTDSRVAHVLYSTVGVFADPSVQFTQQLIRK